MWKEVDMECEKKVWVTSKLQFDLVFVSISKKKKKP